MTKRELLKNIPAEQWDKIKILGGLDNQESLETGKIEEGKFVSKEVFDSIVLTMGDKEVEYEFIDEVEKLEKEVQEFSLSGKEDQPQIRNVILIGSTGNGKSTLGNVLVNKNDNFEEVFRESAGSVSETKGISEEIFEVPITPDGKEKIIYRIIDTIGLGDTTLTQQGVLIKLAEVAERVKTEGLNHILFVAGGRFTEKEIEAYDLLKSVIFDEGVVKYTTIVRTRFDDFQDKAACDEDRGKLRMDNSSLTGMLDEVNIVYVDNPPLKGNKEKEIREASRDKVIKHLVCCSGVYRPTNITFFQIFEYYKTSEKKFEEEKKKWELERKQIIGGQEKLEFELKYEIEQLQKEISSLKNNLREIERTKEDTEEAKMEKRRALILNNNRYNNLFKENNGDCKTS